MLKSVPNFCRPFVPAEIDSILPGSPAEKAGIKKGDKILAVNGVAVDSWNEFTEQTGRLADQMTEAKTTADSLRLRTASIVFAHKAPSATGNDSLATAFAPDTATVVLTADLQLGVGMSSILNYYEPTKVSYGFLESFPAGVKYGFNVLAGYVGDMKYVFTADGAKSLGGFGAIGSLFPPMWDWYMFWKMTAFLSIILAFMNILPIPALDGGHVLFLFYEMITRRKPSETFMIRAEYVGFGILILLMVVANLNDILRWLGYM
jgi:regulator of sigma E protease